MPWTPNDAERHTRKATTSTLKELWAKVANESLERTGNWKQTLWWRGRLKQAASRTRVSSVCPARALFTAPGKALSSDHEWFCANAQKAEALEGAKGQVCGVGRLPRPLPKVHGSVQNR
jgi:hypothetical protein